MGANTWQPGKDRKFGLDLDGTSRQVVGELEGTGFGYVDLPTDWDERRRVIARCHAALPTLRARFAPTPVFGQTVREDPEGEGNYFLYSLGEKAVFA